MNNIGHKARRLLINSGKALPFILCFIVWISYVESLLSICTDDLVSYNGGTILNTPISFWIASKVKYDWLILVVITIVSYAIETCKWHKLAILYLALQLIEKHYLSAVEIPAMGIIVIALANLSICSLFLFKGYYVTIK